MRMRERSQNERKKPKTENCDREKIKNKKLRNSETEKLKKRKLMQKHAG